MNIFKLLNFLPGHRPDPQELDCVPPSNDSCSLARILCRNHIWDTYKIIKKNEIIVNQSNAIREAEFKSRVALEILDF